MSSSATGTGPPPLSEALAWFDHYDRDGTGHLEFDDIVSGLLSAPGQPYGGVDAVRESVRAVWPVFDRDGDGSMDRDEFSGAGGMAESLLLASSVGAREEAAPVTAAYVPSAYAVGVAATPEASAPPPDPHPSLPLTGLWECERCTVINRDSPRCCVCGAPAPATGTPAMALPTAPPTAPPTATATATATAAPPQISVLTTYRVLIPTGTRPGQRLQVQTGDGKAVMVAVPDRRRWSRDLSVGADPFFDVRIPVHNSSASDSYHGQGGTGGSVVSGAVAAASAMAASMGLVSGSNTVGDGKIGGFVSQSMNAAGPNSAAVGGTAAAATSFGHSFGAGAESGSDPHLTPIAQHTVSAQPTKLYLKEKAFSYTGDDAKIVDGEGNTVFRVKAEVLTLSQRRFIYDSAGQKVGQLRKKKTPGLSVTVYLGTPSDEKKLSVVMTGFLNPTKSNASILLGTSKIGKVRGNWRAKQFSIEIDGREVASVTRKRTAASFFAGADSYCINVQAGVDLAFMGLVTIALDELYNDE